MHQCQTQHCNSRLLLCNKHTQNGCSNKCSIKLHRIPIPWSSSHHNFILICTNLFQSTIRMMKIKIQSHEITLQHCYSHFSNHWYISDAFNFEQSFFINIFKGCYIDYGSIWLNPFRW